MIVHEYRINYKYGQEFILKPCMDWHVGDRYCDERALKAYLKEGEDNPDCYIITGGDLVQAITPQDFRYIKSVDKSPDQGVVSWQKDYVYDLLEPYKGRIIGIGLGNHENTILRKAGVHISRELAERLETVSLGYQFMVRVMFSENGSRARQLVIFGQHGWGGGARTEGATITKYARHSTGYDADVYLYGHDHKREKHRVDRISLRGKGLVAKPRMIYFCGTFQKTFSETDEPTWAETRGFNPVAIGGINIRLKPDRSWIKIDSDV